MVTLEEQAEIVSPLEFSISLFVATAVAALTAHFWRWDFQLVFTCALAAIVIPTLIVRRLRKGQP